MTPIFSEFLGILDPGQLLDPSKLEFLPDDCLMVIDMQNDFIPCDALNPDGGRFAVPEGATIAEPIAAMMASCYEAGGVVVVTRDYHPHDHCSFATNGGHFPAHCVQGSVGSRFYGCVNDTVCELLRQDVQKSDDRMLVVFKGFHECVDSFGSFPYDEEDVGSRVSAARERTQSGCQLSTWTGSYVLKCSNLVPWDGVIDTDDVNAPPDVLAADQRREIGEELKKRKCKRLFVCGLALDFCVLDTCRNARKRGFDEVYMVIDAARPAYVPGMGAFNGFLQDPKQIRAWMEEQNVKLTLAASLLPAKVFQSLQRRRRTADEIQAQSPRRVPSCDRPMSMGAAFMPARGVQFHLTCKPATADVPGEWDVSMMPSFKLLQRHAFGSAGALSKRASCQKLRNLFELPDEATHFAFAHPAKGVAGRIKALKADTPVSLQCLHEPNLAFPCYGGFVFFDQGGGVVGCLARTACGEGVDGADLHFSSTMQLPASRFQRVDIPHCAAHWEVFLTPDEHPAAKNGAFGFVFEESPTGDTWEAQVYLNMSERVNTHGSMSGQRGKLWNKPPPGLLPQQAEARDKRESAGAPEPQSEQQNSVTMDDLEVPQFAEVRSPDDWIGTPIFRRFLHMFEGDKPIDPTRNCQPLGPADCLLVIDMQNDFVPRDTRNPGGGRFAVPEGDSIAEPIAALMRDFHSAGATVIATRDYHPFDHCSFTTQGGRFPPHCVQGSYGSCFYGCVSDAVHRLLRRDLASGEERTVVAFKGFHEETDSFGSFVYDEEQIGTRVDARTEKMSPCQLAAWTGCWVLKCSSLLPWDGEIDIDDVNAPPDVLAAAGRRDLADVLRERKCTRLFVCGLALDFCVMDTCRNARARGFDEVYIVLDAARPAYVPGLGVHDGFLHHPHNEVRKWLGDAGVKIAPALSLMSEVERGALLQMYAARKEVQQSGLGTADVCSPLAMVFMTARSVTLYLDCAEMPTREAPGTWDLSKMPSLTMLRKYALGTTGQLSPVAPCEPLQHLAGPGSVSMSFASPVVGVENLATIQRESPAALQCLQEPNLAFACFGGIVFFDARGNVTRCSSRMCCAPSRVSGIYSARFGTGSEWANVDARKRIKEQRRWNAVTLPQLSTTALDGMKPEMEAWTAPGEAGSVGGLALAFGDPAVGDSKVLFYELRSRPT